MVRIPAPLGDHEVRQLRAGRHRRHPAGVPPDDGVMPADFDHLAVIVPLAALEYLHFRPDIHFRFSRAYADTP